ncbi:MAG: nucleotide sugar epimerase, partial [Anaerolineaceae bacterium 4572_5.1]
INELIAILERLIGRKAEVEHYPFHKADAMANQANIEKARNLLGWEPQVSLEEGIRLMVAWYEENREWVKDIDTSK